MDENQESNGVETEVKSPEDTGVGMSEQEQAAPAVALSTVARDRMNLLINNNSIIIDDCKKINALLDTDPQLDGTLCRLFGMKSENKLEVYTK